MVSESKIEQLKDEQLAAFDTEYISEQRWQKINALIQESFPTGEFSFLDVGGGNGRFTDRILTTYPNSRGTILDNSELLLSRNLPNGRKKLLNCSVEALAEQSEHYDLICLNWLLHHLVSVSYSQSRRNIDAVLGMLRLRLTEQGRVSIFENMYDGYIFDGLPSYLIFALTSSQRLAKLISQLGANTAGVGVCFLSRRQWCSVVQRQGFEILAYSNSSERWKFSLPRQLLLHLGNVRMGHFWLSSANKK
jgi:Methyltransferase domain